MVFEMAQMLLGDQNMIFWLHSQQRGELNSSRSELMFKNLYQETKSPIHSSKTITGPNISWEGASKKDQGC